MWGKPVVPPLLERMESLPGDRPGTPRWVAGRLVLKLIVEADMERRGDSGTLEYSTPPEDHFEALRRWWAKEGDAFLSGDGWALPEGVIEVRSLEP
jgi:hypothetical protein